jgi:hypothetical protein
MSSKSNITKRGTPRRRKIALACEPCRDKKVRWNLLICFKFLLNVVNIGTVRRGEAGLWTLCSTILYDRAMCLQNR